VRVIIAELSVVYSGRGESYLPPYKRMLLIKNDGSVSVHNEKGYKPLNYMMMTRSFEEKDVNGERLLEFYSKDESLLVTLHETYQDTNFDIGTDDPGLIRDKTESQLQLWLSENLDSIIPGAVFRSREFETGAGPVDIIADLEDSDEELVIEVKRWASLNSVGQVKRYLEALNERFPERAFKGVLIAVEFKSKTIELARKSNISCFLAPPSWNDDKIEIDEPINLFTM